MARGLGVYGSGSTTDWKNEPETQYFTITGTKKKKNGKGTRPIYSPADAPLGSAAGEAPGTAVQPPRGPATTRPGNETNPGGVSLGDPAAAGTRNYGSVISDEVATGNLYGGIKLGNQALAGVANDPTGFSQADTLFTQKYGLPTDSNTAAFAASEWNPTEKRYGFNTEIGSNLDMINFGANLMDSMVQAGGGFNSQLDPMSMLKNVLENVGKAANAKPGESLGDLGPGNQLTLIAQNPDPVGQLKSLMGIVEGVISGTMPDDSASALMTQLQRAGMAFISRWRGTGMGDSIDMEKRGDNLFRALTQYMSSLI